MLKIKSPAIKTKTGKVVQGKPDHQAIKDKTGVVGKRGFVDSSGKFNSRESAAKIANKAGQTDRPVKLLKSHQLKRTK
jgi:hypothetical protein